MGQEKYVAIINSVGQTVIGKLVNETAETLSIFNPIGLFVQPSKDGSFKIDMYPVLFFEFMDKGSRDKNTWTYSKSQITTSDVVLDERLIEQYEKINTPPPVVEVTPAVKSPKIISINDI